MKALKQVALHIKLNLAQSTFFCMRGTDGCFLWPLIESQLI